MTNADDVEAYEERIAIIMEGCGCSEAQAINQYEMNKISTEMHDFMSGVDYEVEMIEPK